mmetsp:Transcript_86313/g.241559  ORF Transcript_86313/g.241559 Transcript_86313/m.241559 type:complete len:212 (+) Transcript_86313:1027-1662(+)
MLRIVHLLFRILGFGFIFFIFLILCFALVVAFTIGTIAKNFPFTAFVLFGIFVLKLVLSPRIIVTLDLFLCLPGIVTLNILLLWLTEEICSCHIGSILCLAVTVVCLLIQTIQGFYIFVISVLVALYRRVVFFIEIFKTFLIPVVIGSIQQISVSLHLVERFLIRFLLFLFVGRCFTIRFLRKIIFFLVSVFLHFIQIKEAIFQIFSNGII